MLENGGSSFRQSPIVSTMTMEASEIFSKFQHFWRAGTNARLSMECHAGQVWMSLHVHLPSPLPQKQQQHHPRRPGPYRLRRRARRAKAREQTAEKVVESDDSQPAQPHPDPSEKCNAVMHQKPNVSNAAVQAELSVNYHKAEHIDDDLCPGCRSSSSTPWLQPSST